MDEQFQPLPRGRHGLTRDQVRASQRARLVRGMADEVAESGYLDTTVAGVLKRVHVSRQTFYEHFADKQDCFLAVLDESARLMAGALRTGAQPADLPAPQRLARMLATYFATLAEQAAFARVFFVESAAAGLPAHRKRAAIQNLFIDQVADTFRDNPFWRADPDPEFSCRILVGGISSLVTNALVVDGRCPPPETADQVLALAHRLFAPPSGLPGQP